MTYHSLLPDGKRPSGILIYKWLEDLTAFHEEIICWPSFNMNSNNCTFAWFGGGGGAVVNRAPFDLIGVLHLQSVQSLLLSFGGSHSCLQTCKKKHLSEKGIKRVHQMIWARLTFWVINFIRIVTIDPNEWHTQFQFQALHFFIRKWFIKSGATENCILPSCPP